MNAHYFEKGVYHDSSHLIEMKQHLDTFLSAGKMSWWEMDVPTGKAWFSEQKVKMLGYDLKDFENVTYNAFTDLVHPDDHEVTMKAMRDHLEGRKEVYEAEYRIRCKDGSYTWFYDRGGITKRDPQGKPLIVRGVAIDINDIKKTIGVLKEELNDLARFKKVTIGREFRMIELKKEVNQLLMQQGKEPKYRVDVQTDTDLEATLE